MRLLVVGKQRHALETPPLCPVNTVKFKTQAGASGERAADWEVNDFNLGFWLGRVFPRTQLITHYLMLRERLSGR